MHSLLRIVTLSLWFVVAAACTNTFAEGKTVHNRSDSGVLYELSFEADAPEAMQPLPVRITLSGPDGAPISGAKISCSLTMPAMAMPRNAPTIKETGTAGRYEGIFLLTMGGLWEVEFTSVYASGKKEVVVIPIYGINAEGTEGGVDSKLEELFHEKRAPKQ